MNYKENRRIGLLIIAMVYVLAAAIALAVYRQLPNLSLVTRIFWADITGTLIVYLAGVLLKNATVYDPYWSVAPMAVLIGIVISYNLSGTAVWLLLSAVCFWGIRLTINWIMTFEDLNHQDWRYDMLKETFPVVYPLVSLGGIHLFPTLIVFFALVPAIRFLQQPVMNSLTATAFVICVLAVILQFVADIQMHAFRKTRTSRRQLMRSGLWRYARHPNYFAEIVFWWGIYLFLLSAAPADWYLGIGALLNTAMFLFISIPMAERRMRKQKDGYTSYKNATRIFLPIRK